MEVLFIMMIQVIFVLVLICETFTSELKKGDPCVTPNLENATCIPLRDCDVIYTATVTFDLEAFQFAQASKCGSTMGMVCCGSSGHLYDESTPPSLEEKINLSSFSDESVCGLDTLSYRIKGGTLAKFEEFPWLAALEFKSRISNENAGIRCGGSIINHKYILTAAHCIVDQEFEVIKAWVGVTNISSDENCLYLTGTRECVNSTQKLDVEKTTAHPRYQRSNGYNDIGLLRLKIQIEFNNYIRPICLPSPDLPSPRIGNRMTVAGWGITENATTSDVKLKVVLPVQNASICNKFLESDGKNVSSDQLCVGGERGKDSCEGDSGGPLMKDFKNANQKTQWYQEGIVSYGVGCGGKGRPGVYIRVSRYVDWIFSKLNEVTLDKRDPCTTPDGKAGTCVPLNTCRIFYDAAYTKNITAHDFAKESFCRYDNEPLVCCESPGPVIVPNFETKALPDRTVCGVAKEESRIYGGEITELGEFPWMVLLEGVSVHTGKRKFGCSGSLISNRYVLTTAHCLLNVEVIPLTAWLGEWKTSTDPDCKTLIANIECADKVQKVAVKQTIPHLFYDEWTKYSNIGLILLENEVQFTDYISPICLPHPYLPSPELGLQMTIVGWGQTENSNVSDILRKVEIPVVSNEECNKIIGEFTTTQQLCAGGEKGKDCCYGDTGGPLMRSYEDKPSGRIQWYQDGIIAYGDRGECGRAGVPSVYIQVSSYMDWIISIISED